MLLFHALGSRKLEELGCFKKFREYYETESSAKWHLENSMQSPVGELAIERLRLLPAAVPSRHYKYLCEKCQEALYESFS